MYLLKLKTEEMYRNGNIYPSGIHQPTQDGRKFAHTLFTVWFLVKRSMLKMLFMQLMS